MEERIRKTITRQFKAIFPNTLNANNTLFGGEAMKWMDEVAYITATRFTRQKMFTLKTEDVKFLKAVTPDTIVEVVGKVEKADPIKLRVILEIYAEDMYADTREKVMESVFIFVALNDNNKPVRIDYSRFEKEKEVELDLALENRAN
ncbi:acyl-CoA thioesterase [Flammeovirga yaeyamensis]|uniref:Acyl-CoA thioesterase n=1 Tax=Flammeovirga yaeyamensis TaxID=367791 RepID=A0AAX1N4F9_9BACT|nr:MULTISPECIES: hotdog domain-containing protein [Flammeovirga]ANQ47574.1 acyl-CoA thioesterase [Flammeovirga sp. MY04]MBB3698615.1 acyl-CoA hydrolase [Flammeovirga yaeyamensis]NMF34037.1 acyl-CoA thioesterase [Flammeovirga yaeyamensis]QWG01025.1 acyl-CoA thioesterase [Flammeovirga yaeyamensis]